MAVTDIAATFDIVEQFTSGVYALRFEIGIFLFAFVAHSLLSGRLTKVTKGKGEKPKASASEPRKSPSQPQRNAKTLSADAICKGCAGKPEDATANLRVCLEDVKDHEVVPTLCALVQGAGRSPMVELLAAVRAVAKERSLQLNCALGEVLLRGCYSAHSTSEFEAILAEVEAEAASSSAGLFAGVGVQALKNKLREGAFEAALNRLDKPRQMWEGLTRSPSAAPKALLQWLTRLAVQQDHFQKLVEKLKATNLFADAFELIVVECAQHGDANILQTVEALGRKEGLKFSQGTYCVLLQATQNDEDAVHMFQEAIRSFKTSKELVIAASCAALTHSSVTFADVILKNLPSEPPAEAAGKLLQLYAAREGDDSTLLTLYTKRFGSLDLSGDVVAERLIAEACIRSSRLDVLKNMLATTTDCTKRVALLKSLCTDRKMDAAFEVFAAFPSKAGCLYNAMIDACFEQARPERAQKLMEDAIKAGVADTVSYNTCIKAYLGAGNASEAKKMVQCMKDADMPPNCVTFNELMDACIKKNVDDVFLVLDEMSSCGVKPNHITCSILLKTIRAGSSARNVERVLNVMDSVAEEMDEVLLSSVVEACIRAGRVDLLVPHLKRQCSSRKIQVRGPHTYGSIIRAYGFVNDISGAWETWREMRTRKIVPTAVTLGCMVEAVVSSGDPEAGYELIQDVLSDEQCKPLVNAVIYCSVLKGFSHQKKFDRFWEVYQEMLVQKVTFSIVTFNTMVDACSRCGEMSRIPELLRIMVSQGIEPNLITYSAICKGYCQENKLDEAFELKKGMVQTTKFKPDEIMYNTLLDGCARQGLYDRGMTVLAEMMADNINPSNFTLSLLVKLCSRSKRLDRAFTIVNELSVEYKFKPNIHVYGNLIQACIQQKDLNRAFEVMESFLNAGVRPDLRSYSLLLRACLVAKEAPQAAGLMRAAVGLRGVHPRLMGYAQHTLQPQGGLPQALISEVIEGIAGSPCHEEMLALSLLKDLRTKPHVKVDPRLQMRLATRAAGR